MVAIAFSGLGVLGWLAMIMFHLLFPYPESQRAADLFGPFLRNVVILGVGGSVLGLFTLVGLITSFTALALQKQPRMAFSALWLSLAGIVLALVVFFWRVLVVLS